MFPFPLAVCIFVQSMVNGEKHRRSVLFVDIGYFCSGRKITVRESVFLNATFVPRNSALDLHS